MYNPFLITVLFLYSQKLVIIVGIKINRQLILINLVRIRRYERSLPQWDIIINCIVDNELCRQLLINDEHCQLYGHNALTDRYSLTIDCSVNFWFLRRVLWTSVFLAFGNPRLKDLYFLSSFRSCLTNKLFFLVRTTTNKIRKQVCTTTNKITKP